MIDILQNWVFRVLAKYRKNSIESQRIKTPLNLAWEGRWDGGDDQLKLWGFGSTLRKLKDSCLRLKLFIVKLPSITGWVWTALEMKKWSILVRIFPKSDFYSKFSLSRLKQARKFNHFPLEAEFLYNYWKIFQDVWFSLIRTNIGALMIVNGAHLIPRTKIINRLFPI